MGIQPAAGVRNAARRMIGSEEGEGRDGSSMRGESPPQNKRGEKESRGSVREINEAGMLFRGQCIGRLLFRLSSVKANKSNAATSSRYTEVWA